MPEQISQMYQTADFKSEKHVPVIECDDTVSKDEMFQVKVSLGKEIAHPNKTEHHIKWIRLFFHPEGDKYPYEIGAFEFGSHGASVKGPDTSGVYTHHEVIAVMKTDKPGTLMSTAYCNIHGLWQSEKEIRVS